MTSSSKLPNEDEDAPSTSTQVPKNDDGDEQETEEDRWEGIPRDVNLDNADEEDDYNDGEGDDDDEDEDGFPDEFDADEKDFKPTKVQKAQWRRVKRYVLENCLTDFWLSEWTRIAQPHFVLINLHVALWMDIGLLPEETRNGTRSVNNWGKRAFQLVDTVFLDCRKNKRCATMCFDCPY